MGRLRLDLANRRGHALLRNHDAQGPGLGGEGQADATPRAPRLFQGCAVMTPVQKMAGLVVMVLVLMDIAAGVTWQVQDWRMLNELSPSPMPAIED